MKARRFFEKLYRLVLRVFPLEFREEYGDEMKLAAREQAREGFLPALSSSLKDLFIHAPREHWQITKQDSKLAFRGWLSAPGVPSAAIFALALGIGVSTAMFSIVYGVMFRPLVAVDPDRLVRLYESSESLKLVDSNSSVPDYLFWKEHSRGVELAAFGGQTLNWTGDHDAERLEAVAATASYASVIGNVVQGGRWFSEAEQRQGQHRVAVLSEKLWRQRFESDPGIVGRTLTLNAEPYLIIGIAAVDLRVPTEPDLWVPLITEPAPDRGIRYMTVVGRLRNDFTMSQAQQELQGLSHGDQKIHLVALLDWLVPHEIQTALIVLFIAGVLVLLTACVNIANLLLARAEARRKEIAIRAALGAGTVRLSRQMLTESVLLATAGGMAGFIVAGAAIQFAGQSLIGIVPRSDEVVIDPYVFGYTAVVSMFTGLLFGMAPLWRITPTRPLDAIQSVGRTSRVEIRNRLRTGLAVSQIALATLLSISAGLMIKSFAELQQVETGLDSASVMTAQFTISRSRYPNTAARSAMFTRLREALEATPGIQSAGIGSAIPLGPDGHTSMRAAAIASAEDPLDSAIRCEWRLIDEGFFGTLGIPLLRGRTFSTSDMSSARRVFVIGNETARALYGSENPVGRSLELENGWTGEVIGVVGDLRMKNLSDPPDRVIYMPVNHFGNFPLFALFVKTRDGIDTAPALIRAGMKEIDAALPLYNIRPLNEWIYKNSARPRLRTGVLATFASLAVVLGLIGIYGTLSYLVTLRRHEFSVRIAIGAAPMDVLKLVMTHGFILSLVGIALGTASALVLTNTLGALLYGVDVHDPFIFTIVPALFLISGLCACFLPSLRASRVDPVATLQ